MRVTLIQAPYALGRARVEVATGPIRIVEAGAAEALREAGHEVEVEVVETGEEGGSEEAYWNEIEGTFEVVRRVADRVKEAVKRGSLPVVLAGNCFNSIGVVAGGSTDVGVVWFDAHGDFSTPATTLSGFLDGMGLSVLTGTGWDTLRETVPGYRVVPERNVVLVGVRDTDPDEDERLESSEIWVVPPTELGDGLDAGLDALRGRIADVYLHLDLDVLDASEGRVNLYAAEGGPSAEEVASAIRAVGERFRIRAAAVTAYDPGADPEGRVPPIAISLLVQIAEAAASRRMSAA
jgi:arginase